MNHFTSKFPMNHIHLATLLAAFSPTLLLGQTYSVVDLGVPGGRPQAINESGVIAGWYTSGGSTRAFVYDPATAFSDIGVLPGMSFAAARDINSLGQVVGSSWPTPIAQPGRAFLYTPGVGMTDLGTLPAGSTSEASCIDDLGNVGGRAEGTAILPEAFFRPAGGPMQSERPGFLGATLDVDASGWRVGTISNNRPFYIPPGGVLAEIVLPAPTPMGRATAVSASGWIAGEMSDPSGSPSFAFRYDATTGQLTNLGSISRFGTVTGIDSVGTVIAIRQINSQSDPVALISIDGTQVVPVDTFLPPGSPWTIRTVSGINEAGQLCGRGSLSGGGTAPVRLDPIVSGTPATASVLSSGCGAVLARAGHARLGHTWRFAIGSAAPGQDLFTVISLGQFSGIPVPGSTCDLFTSATAPMVTVFATANAQGSWADTLQVPASGGLVGLPLTLQAVVVDPAAVLGFITSEAVLAIVGD